MKEQATAKKAGSARKARRAGLHHWLQRVLRERDRVARDFSPDPVHDLRVALRRCRSLADGMMAVDSYRGWRAMKKASRRLFRRLGRLRDLQVMISWVEKLSPAEDPVRAHLVPLLREQEEKRKQKARQALAEFNPAAWKLWAQQLPRRARRLALDGPVFRHIALERFEEAHALHRRALHSPGALAFHRVRIALKRFRYTLENFLPSRADWLLDLKHLQDLLGELHDLDVLRAAFFTRRRMFPAADCERWCRWIQAERQSQLDAYRAKMVGRASLWRVWRAGLPQGAELEAAALAMLRVWASFLDPRFAHSEQVSRLALNLLDAYTAANGALRRDPRARRILQAAALVHEVGRAEHNKAHHKLTYKMVAAFPPPLGWTVQEVQQTALVARYHRGAEPRATHAGFHTLTPAARQRVLWLSGLLRLADALVRSSGNRVSRLKLERHRDADLIWAQGYVEDQKSAALLGGRKHLLESVVERPVIIRAWPRAVMRARGASALGGTS